MQAIVPTSYRNSCNNSLSYYEGLWNAYRLVSHGDKESILLYCIQGTLHFQMYTCTIHFVKSFRSLIYMVPCYFISHSQAAYATFTYWLMKLANEMHPNIQPFLSLLEKTVLIWLVNHLFLTLNEPELLILLVIHCLCRSVCVGEVTFWNVIILHITKSSCSWYY